MRWLCFLFCLGLSACNMPSPGFRGIPPTRIAVDGSVFDVRINGTKAEAMRVNPQYAPRFGIIAARAERAMAQVSGCDVTRVTGDQALAFGRLRCKPGARPRPPVYPSAERQVVIECEPVRGSAVKEVGQVRIDLACDPQ